MTYTYDAFDRMTKRVLDPDGNLGSATPITEEFFYDGDELVHMRSSVAGESHYYLIDPNTGDVLFDQKGSAVYATLTDHLGSVRDLVNTSGQVVNHLVYDAFGNRTSETNPQGGAVPFSPQMGFTGQWLDQATGLQYNHHRWYDPATGRWLSEDPIGFAGADGNLYRYVGNNAAGSVGSFLLKGISTVDIMFGDNPFPAAPISVPQEPPVLDSALPGLNPLWNGDRSAEWQEGMERYRQELETERRRIERNAKVLREPSTLELAVDGILTIAGGNGVKLAVRAGRSGRAAQTCRLLPGVGAAERTWSGKQLDWLAKELGIDRRRLGNALHKIKYNCGRGGADDVHVGVQTGNVYDDAGEYLGNVFDEFVK